MDDRLQNDGPADSLDALGETVAFRLGTLNVQGWARKQKEVEATVAQFDLDALFCSETRGLEADGYRILRAESKGWWLLTSESINEYGDSTQSTAVLGLRVLRAVRRYSASWAHTCPQHLVMRQSRLTLG